jgi:hypothetical protein
LEGSQTSPVCPCKANLQMKMSMAHLCTLSQFNHKNEGSEHWSSDRHFYMGKRERWFVQGITLSEVPQPTHARPSGRGTCGVT